MKYMLLIYADVSKKPDYTPAQLQAAQQDYAAYMTEMQTAGVLMDDEGFHVISNARTVRVREDKTLTADTPFAETPEQLTGYIVFDCKDLDAATRWAARNPAAKYGSIEVRPVDAWTPVKAEVKPTDGKEAVGKR